MPTPRMSDEVALQALQAYEEHHHSWQAAAESLGIPVSTFQKRLQKARKRNLHLDPAIRNSMEAAGTGMAPKLAWVKTKNEDGTSYSVLLKPDAVDDTDDVLERIAARVEKIRPAPMVKRAVTPSTEYRNFVPLFDVHMSMRVGDYGTHECVERLREGAQKIIGDMPAAECTIIVNGGDFTEQNDPSNLTPQSKHPLAVDMEYDDTADIATDVTVELIEMARQRSDKVIYKALRGNHDPQTARIIRAALRQRYRNDDSVSIEADGIEMFAHVWEGNMLAALHGDLRKAPKDIIMALAARFPGLWAETWFREVFYGHLHHLKTAEFPGMTSHQLRAIAPMGRYATENLFESLSEMVGITYRKGGGRQGTYPHTFKPRHHA
jgi:transposase-like protein